MWLVIARRGKYSRQSDPAAAGDPRISNFEPGIELRCSHVPELNSHPSDYIIVAPFSRFSSGIAIAMGVVRTLLTWTGYGSLAGVGTFAWATRGSRVLPLPQTDYLYNTTWYARYNAENNQPVSDVCVRRVPLNQIRPELLEKDGKLVERFCAGVWGGIGEHWPDGRVAKTYRSRY